MLNLKDKKIWIAGHTGLVGSACMRVFKQKGLSDFVTATHTELDLTRQNETEEWIAEHRPEVVVMAAAEVGGIGANVDTPADMIYRNVAMAQNIIHISYKVSVEKLIYLGSSCIYPSQLNEPLQENDLLTRSLEPSNEFYALAKITGLKMCEAYSKQYGCNFISAMPCNLYGLNDQYDERRSHVIPALIMKFHQAKINNDSHVTLWGNGNPRREFLFSDDLAEALHLLLQTYDEDTPVNVGAGYDISISELAHTIKNIVGYEGEVKYDTSQPDGVHRKLMSSGKINKLGWKQKTLLDEGIQKTYQDYLSRLIAPVKAA